MNIKYTKKEKIAYNKAIKKVAKLVSSYDGLIPCEIDRKVIVDEISKLQKKIK